MSLNVLTQEEADAIVREAEERLLEKFMKPYCERLEWRREPLRTAEMYREVYIKNNIELRWIEGEIEAARESVENAEKD